MILQQAVRWASAAAFVVCSAGAIAQEKAQELKVVASIKPVHSLVAAVMDGAGSPSLIVAGAGSPHTYTMRPGDAKAIEDARVVFWIGKEMEQFLVDPLKTLARNAQVVSLADAPGVVRREFRTGGVWEEHSHNGHGHSHGHSHGHAHDQGRKQAEKRGHSHGHSHGHAHGKSNDDHAQGTVDMHMWLDPENARAFARHIAATLAEVDPGNKDLYAKNAAALIERLGALETELAEILKPVQKAPFIVFHDAFQYFEQRFGLNGVGAISLGDARAPGARRLREIRARVNRMKGGCVFSEPQFPPRLVKTVIEGSKARSGELDPLGAAVEDGPDLYFTIMRNNARALRDCLGPAG